jgi:hypothetical protein
MTDSLDHKKPEGIAATAAGGRREFVKGAAAGLLGAAGLSSALSHSVEAEEAVPQKAVEDPQAPPGLAPNALLDARFPMTYETSVPEGVRVVMGYFAALARRDMRGIAEMLHFPFASYEGTDPVAIQNVDELMAHAPASINMSKNPERFTDHDGYMKPGSYDMFDGLEVFNSDPVSVNLSLAYNRYGSDGKQLLRCEGIYCITNNDGKWGIQLMSTIFTPADMVGMVYTDTIEQAKRIRINHDLAYQVADAEGVWGPVLQLGPRAGVANSTVAAFYGRVKPMDPFRVKGVKTRLSVSEVTAKNFVKDPNDFIEYRKMFKKSGVGDWGFTYGILPTTRVVHATVNKAHMFSGVTRYTTAGEEISRDGEISIITYKKGRWGLAGGLSYVTAHDRANDARTV